MPNAVLPAMTRTMVLGLCLLARLGHADPVPDAGTEPTVTPAATQTPCEPLTSAFLALPASVSGTTCMALSPDGRHLACGDGDGNVGVIEVDGARARWSARLRTAPVECLGFTADGEALLVSGGGIASRHHAETGRPVGRESFAAMGQHFHTSSRGTVWWTHGQRNLVLWDDDRDFVSARIEAAEEIERVHMSPDGSWLCLECQDGLFEVWTSAGTRVSAARLVEDMRPLYVRWDGDRVRILAEELLLEGADELTLIDLSSGAIVGQVGIRGIILAALWHDEGWILSPSGQSVWWQPPGSTEFSALTVRADRSVTRFETAGGRIAALWSDGGVSVWDRAIADLPATRVATGPIEDLDCSADGRFIVTLNAAGTVEIRDLAEGNSRLERLRCETRPVSIRLRDSRFLIGRERGIDSHSLQGGGACYRPLREGQWLTADLRGCLERVVDGTLDFRDLATDSLTLDYVTSIDWKSAEIHASTLSPDGQTLLLADGEGAVFLADLTEPDPPLRRIGRVRNNGHVVMLRWSASGSHALALCRPRIVEESMRMGRPPPDGTPIWLHLFDVASGRWLDFPEDLGSVPDVAVSPRGETVAIIEEPDDPRDQRHERLPTRTWLWAVGRAEAKVLDLGARVEPTCVAFSADGRSLFVGSRSGHLVRVSIPP